MVLSRPAVITRDLHPFEQAFFFYQRRLNDRLALPFSRYFYFKRGTPADIEWKRRQKERITPSRDIGRYDAYGKFGWNDELLVGAPESEPQHQVDALLKDAEAPAVGGGPEAGKEVGAEQAASTRVEVEKPMPRVTEADKRGDQKSLDRMLQRALYLLVQGADGSWVFPTARLEGSESLVEVCSALLLSRLIESLTDGLQAAQRTLTQSAGPNMNTWIVGNVPIGHHAEDYETPVRGGADGQRYELGAKTFFVKGRIMTGQADVTDNLHGFKDFRWLAKEEIAQLVTPHYWRMTEDMLVER